MVGGIRRRKVAVKGGTATSEGADVNRDREKVQREKLLENIESTVLQTKNKLGNVILDRYVNAASRENYIKSAIVNLMSTPEYQLC